MARFWEDGAKTSKLFGTKPPLKVQLFTIDGLTHNLENSSFCAKMAWCGKDIMCHQSDSLVWTEKRDKDLQTSNLILSNVTLGWPRL